MALGCFASISVLNICFIAALILLVLRVERNGWKVQRLPGIDIAIGVYAAAFVVSALMGVDPQSSFEYITELKRPVIAYVVASSITTRRDAWMVSGSALFGGSVSVAIELYQWIYGGSYRLHQVVHTYEPWALTQPMGLSATHNDLATLLAQALGLALVPLFFFFRSLTWPQRLGALLCTVTFAGGILRTLSRASLLASLGGLIVVGLTLRPRRLIGVFLVLGLVYAVLPDTLKQRHHNVFDLQSNYSNWFRYRMMEVSKVIIKRSFPWGIGRRNFPVVHKEIKQPDEEISPHAHNNYLQILCEMGLLGIVGFIWIQLAVVYYLARRAASVRYAASERMLLGGLLMGYVSFVVNGFFHYDWGDALPCCYMWILVGMSCAVGEKLALNSAPEPACGGPPSAASTVPA